MTNNSQSFGNKIRELRETHSLFLRQVAATLEVDTAFLSKVERNEKQLRREHINKLAELFGVNENELHTHWLSDKILELVKDKTIAEQSLKLTLKRLKN